MFLRMPNARDRFMQAEVVPMNHGQPFASSSLSSPLLILPLSLWQVLLPNTGILI